ncbi:MULTISPECIES: hypothetical protein [unclassified Amycolatopsis]|uniref:hypothetical protein n=1 Tax=unclassified Amycolatopsis TaxID=2618356 RepID=UPI00287523EC|nr:MULTISPECIES: hypothetical protein [unclassified Amycolatopsis]MDS0134292.1 hypothetical protein [Amycolatopsis sp. 505]MDS0149609.1 hypothetical protein [Amycolatopsis sp. CM201R]
MVFTKPRDVIGRVFTVVAIAAAALGATSADASASADPPASGAVSDIAVAKEVARIKARGGLSAAAPPNVWRVDGSSDTWNGGCWASAHADYYPANDQAEMSTTVRSPYLFAACRVNAQLWIETASGSFPSAVNYGMACAVWDPTCASTQTWPGNHNNATPDLTAFVAAVNATLQTLGLPPTYTRAMAITGVHLTFSNAS